jgi:hypothetical protein
MASKHRPIPAILCALVALTIFLAAPAAFAALNYVKTTVTPNGLADGNYAVNDRGQVAWVEGVLGDDQIFLYSNGQNTQITTNTANNKFITSLQINNLGQIAWSQYDYNPGGTGLNVNVYLYDGNSYKPLNNNQGQYGWYSLYPCLNNRGEVAWLQSYQPGAPDNNAWDVYLYTGGGVTRLTDDKNQQGPPRLNDNGWVTWHGNRSQDWDWDNRVYLYDGANTQVIAYTPGQHCSAPQINNLGQVAWINWNSNATPYHNIYLWNGTNTKITNLNTNNYNGNPFVLNNTGQIAWCWAEGMTPRQVYLYNNGVAQLTNAAYDHTDIGLRDNGWLIWRLNNGQNLADIYVFQGGSTTLIAQGSDLPAVINSKGQVVWASYYPIFLSSPVIAAPGINSLLLSD